MWECERAQAHFNDFLDGTLQASEALDLNAHLERCELCTREFHALKRTQELLRGAVVPNGELPRGRVLACFRQSVAVAPREEKPVTPSIPWTVRLMPVGLAAATLALLLFQVHSLRPTERGHIGNAPPLLTLAAASSTTSLPTSSDLDTMASLHAVQSFTMMDGNEQMQLDALADANSRLHVDKK